MADELRYTIRRFNWRWAGTCFVRAPGEHRLTTFDTPDEANAEAWKREQEVRGRVNPFSCGPAFHYLSTMPEPIYLDWLRDADITPPEPDATGKRPWVVWWDSTKAELSESQNFRVWEGLNRVRFFDVIARRTSQVAYAVVRIMWDYNDAWDESGEEGGESVVAFKNKAAAESRRRELETAERNRRRDTQGTVTMQRWDEARWPHPTQQYGDCDDISSIPFFEVIEVDVI